MSMEQSGYDLQQLLLALILPLIVTSKEVQKNNTPQVCRTPECIQISKDIRSQMDTKADPCEDMYQFACGEFHKQTSLQTDILLSDKMMIVREEIDLLTLKSMNGNSSMIQGRHSDAVSKAQTYLKNCMDVKTINERGTEDLEKLIISVGSWSVVECNDLEQWNRMNWSIKENLPLIHKASIGASLWSFEFVESPSNPNRTVFSIQQKGLTLGMKENYANGTVEEYRDAYMEFALGVGDLLGGIRENVREKMSKVFEFEQRLAQIYDNRNNYVYTNISALQKMFGSVVVWEDYLSKMFSKRLLGLSDKVIIHNPGYFDKLAALLSNTDKEVLTNYLIWRLICKAVQFLPVTFAVARKPMFEKLYRSSGVFDKNITCPDQTMKHFRPAATAILVENYDKKNIRDEVRSMLDEIQHQFIQNLDNVSWLDDKTRLAVKEKVEAMKKFVGYPEWIRNIDKLDEIYKHFDVEPGNYLGNFVKEQEFILKREADNYPKNPEKDEWHETPNVLNFFYSHQQNAVFFPFGLIRYPIASVHYPKSYFYGGVGSWGGHEMMHGINEGNTFAEQWTKTSIDTFTNKSDCIVKFYNKYELHGLKVDGEQNKIENMCDSFGLKYAYKAFKAVQRDNDFILPDLYYPPDQLFFIAYSQNHCYLTTAALEMEIIEENAHALHKSRVLGPISLSKEFAEAFQCKPNSKMNPSDKCEIW